MPANPLAQCFLGVDLLKLIPGLCASVCCLMRVNLQVSHYDWSVSDMQWAGVTWHCQLTRSLAAWLMKWNASQTAFSSRGANENRWKDTESASRCAPHKGVLAPGWVFTRANTHAHKDSAAETHLYLLPFHFFFLCIETQRCLHVLISRAHRSSQEVNIIPFTVFEAPFSDATLILNFFGYLPTEHKCQEACDFNLPAPC